MERGFLRFLGMMDRNHSDLDSDDSEYDRSSDNEFDDSEEDTALDRAIQKGDKAAINKYSFSNGGYSSLYYAVQKKQPETIKMLISNPNAKWRQDTSREWSPLHEACQNGYLEGVNLLLTSKFWKKAINWTNREQESALHIALQNGNRDIIKKLVRNGANVALRSFENSLTPLQQACDEGMLDVVKTMLGKRVCSDPNGGMYGSDAPKSTELTCAAENGHTEIVKLLIKHGYDVDDKDEINGDAPLHKASMNGYHEIVEILLKNNASVNSKNDDGHTALHLAVKEDKYNVVKVLLQYKADASIKSESNQTPLDIAQENGNSKLVNILQAEKLEEETDDAPKASKGIKRKRSALKS